MSAKVTVHNPFYDLSCGCRVTNLTNNLDRRANTLVCPSRGSFENPIAHGRQFIINVFDPELQETE